MSRSSNRPLAAAARRPVDRTLHAIDVDNLLGSARILDRRYIERLLTRYREASRYISGDHVVMATGCNGLHVLETELAWEHVAHRRRQGRDGADTLLLEELEWVASSRRFDRVVIGSGDHAFAQAARNLIRAGITVHVVACPQSLSHELRRAVGTNLRLIARPVIA